MYIDKLANVESPEMPKWRSRSDVLVQLLEELHSKFLEAKYYWYLHCAAR